MHTDIHFSWQRLLLIATSDQRPASAICNQQSAISIRKMDFASERLCRSFLTRSPWKTSRDVVRALGAVQAQDYDGAKWAISQRTGLADDAIEREFTSGAILRTHVLRPTWHFVDPADIRWMLGLSAPRISRVMSTYDRTLGLDENVYRRSSAVIARALRDNNYLTRSELKIALTRAKFAKLEGQRMMRLVMRAELDAIICSGPRRKKQQTYALLDERVPSVPVRDRDEDLLDLTLRYFAGRSPATAHDFSWWSGLSMRDVKRGIDLATKQLERIESEGKTYWRSGPAPALPGPTAHLLPNYDEFFIGYRDRSAIGRRLGNVGSVTGGSTLISNVLVVDGQLVGGWKRTIDGDAIVVQASMLARLSRSERDRLEEAVRVFETFAQRKVRVKWLPRTSRVKTR
jgi:hypothetical protein